MQEPEELDDYLVGKTIKEHYIVTANIGRGSNGLIYSVKDRRDSDKPLVMKVCLRKEDEFKQERRILDKFGLVEAYGKLVPIEILYVIIPRHGHNLHE